MDLSRHNRQAWDKLSGPNCPWSKPVSGEEISLAKKGAWELTLAGPTPVPEQWLGDIKGASVLCLAAGGGQQAPILAAAGAHVVLLDISDKQLALDRALAREHALAIQIEQGDMTNLSRFEDESFDVVFNPVSNPYVADLQSVWDECARVLKPQGRLLAGSINPYNYLFEENEGTGEEGLTVKYKLPFVEREILSEKDLAEAIKRKMVFTWSHSLEEIIGGQIKAGFMIAGLFESRRTDARAPLINQYAPTYIATLAIKASPGLLG